MTSFITIYDNASIFITNIKKGSMNFYMNYIIITIVTLSVSSNITSRKVYYNNFTIQDKTNSIKTLLLIGCVNTSCVMLQYFHQ